MAYETFSRFYDTLTNNVDYEKRADYFCRLLSPCKKSGSILLDLACGTGSMSVEMAKRGFDVIGVDPSAGMLTAAREKIAESGYDILLLCQSAGELDLYGTVDCAVCCLDSVNHFDGADEVKKAFSKVSLFMNKGGLFVFDVNTVYKHRGVLADNTFVYDCEGVYCAWQNSLNPDFSVDITLDFFAENENGLWERSGEEFTEYAYEIDEIKSMLEEAGFSVQGVYDDMTENPVKSDSERAVFVARKE